MGVSELTASAVAMSNMRIDENPTTSQAHHAPITNRAGESKNPYVKSYANSPVAWQPLDNDAIDRAKNEGKLIFLHIGYKACHYCRLMATESFSNSDCAAVLNEYFIPVVIDREERPDLDTIYMNYIQAVSNVGGWPLNLFLTPELAPVFGGTYWTGPETSKRAIEDNEEDEAIDFLNIVKKVRDIWKDQETRCRIEASEIVGQLREFAAEGTIGTRSIAPSQTLAQSGWGAPTSAEASTSGDGEKANATVSSELDLDQLEEAYTHIAGTFDPVYGGFGLAPKFLTPPKLRFLLQLSRFPSAVQDVVGEAECKHATDMAVDTLRKIRDGALHDHIGETGFSRCSVTADWSIPNFEKLVTDNALLLSLYVDAWKTSGGKESDEFYNVVVELSEYLTSAPIALSNRLFASSEAADTYYKKGDSEMREGAYYLWTRREFDSVIEAAKKGASQTAAAYFNVLEDGNVEENNDPNDDFINQNILRITRSTEELSKQLNIPVEKVEEDIKAARAALKARSQRERVRPEVDNKAVTAWNALVISALAKASTALKTVKPELSDKYLKAATAAASALQEKLWDATDKTLYRVMVDGVRQTEGFADDYAFLIRGLLDLYDVTGDEKHVQFADTLQTIQISKFYDSAGAFFTTTPSSPFTILRLKDGMDTSLPSINAVSVTNLFQLGHLVQDEKLTAMARASINAFEVEMLQHPWLYPGLLGGVVTARLGLQDKKDAQLSFVDSRQKA